MKNFSKVLVFVLAFIAISCNKNKVSIESKNTMPEWALQKYPFLASVISVGRSEALSNQINSEGQKPRPKKRFRFRWNGCKSPLGVCYIIPIGGGYEEEENEDSGGAKIYIEDSKMYIKPERVISFADGTVPITNDIIIDKETASEFGYTSVVIQKGLYLLDYTNDTVNGELFVNVVTEK